MKFHVLVWSLLLTVLALVPSFAQDPEPLDPSQQGFKMADISFYQTNVVLSQRMPSSDAFADYVKRMMGVLVPFFRSSTTPENLDVVVAVRPGQKVRIWFISSSRPSNCLAFEALKKQLAALPTLNVRGEVAFAVTGKICGGVTRALSDEGSPIPEEWKQARLKYPSLAGVDSTDAYLDAVWPK